jgi:hypothetical protein
MLTLSTHFFAFFFLPMPIWQKSPVIKIIKIVIFLLHALPSQRKSVLFLSCGFSFTCITEKKYAEKIRSLFLAKNFETAVGGGESL